MNQADYLDFLERAIKEYERLIDAIGNSSSQVATSVRAKIELLKAEDQKVRSKHDHGSYLEEFLRVVPPILDMGF